jgi:hypothetical protein
MDNSGEEETMKDTEGEEASERSSEAPLCITSDEVNYLVFRYVALDAVVWLARHANHL